MRSASILGRALRAGAGMVITEPGLVRKMRRGRLRLVDGVL
jgi:hypothetical protein